MTIANAPRLARELHDQATRLRVEGADLSAFPGVAGHSGPLPPTWRRMSRWPSAMTTGRPSP